MVSPTPTISLVQEGIALARAGDRERARDRLREAIRHSPLHETAWFWLSKTAETPADAVSALQKVLNINRNNQRAHDELTQARLQAGMVAARANRREEAREYLRSVVAADPGREQAWFWLAAVAETPQQSIECLHRVLELSPRNRKAQAALRISRFQAGVAEAQEGRRDRARELLQAVVAEEPGHEAAWHWLSSLTDSPDAATAFLRKVLEINPDNAQAMDDLRRCEMEMVKAQAPAFLHPTTRVELDRLRDAIARRRSASAFAESLEPWSGPRVLVVDGCPEVRSNVSHVLAWQGFQVVAAADGQEATEQARRFNPELILMAVDLPDLDGFQVCRQFQAQAATKPIPIVALTSTNECFEKTRGSIAGCQDYLLKPVCPVRLLEIAREYTSPVE